MPEPLPDLKAGIYRHYKGYLDLVLGYAEDSTNSSHGGQVFVVYVGLDLAGTPSPGPRMKVRLASEFFEQVHPETGMPLALWAGPTYASVPRFTYVGASYSDAA